MITLYIVFLTCSPHNFGYKPDHNPTEHPNKLEKNQIRVNEQRRVAADSQHEVCNASVTRARLHGFLCMRAGLKDGDTGIRLMTTCIL